MLRNTLFAALLLSLASLVEAAPPAEGYTNGLTENFDLYFDQDEARIRERLDHYESIGVELLRLHAFPGDGQKEATYLKVLEDYDFRVKMILYALPAQTFTDENGAKSKPTINFWNPEGRPQLMQRNRAILNRLRNQPVWDKIDYLVPTLGPAGELTYPPTWTTGLPHMTFWCYDEHAQANFRDSMRSKYQTVEKANEAWGTNFSSWEEVKVLKPGTHPGNYWQDILTWYRDSKRAFARWHILEMQKLTDKELILYVPGHHYTAEAWDQAVASAGKHASPGIKAMLDSDFLLELAAETDTILQYTGLSRAESIYISKASRKLGYEGIIYGENAGHYGPASSPLGLSGIVVEAGYAGIDYTDSRFLFEKDLRTPTPFLRELGDGFQLMKGNEPPTRWNQRPEYVDDKREAIWTILPVIGERYGLHGMLSGDDPPSIAERLGKTGWQIGPSKGEKCHLYAAIQHPDLGMGQSPDVSIVVEYFDGGHATVRLDYDSSDTSVQKAPGKPGAFKSHPNLIQLSNSKQWKTATFEIKDGEFSNRCNARDFRLTVSDNGMFIIRSLAMIRSEK